MKNKYIFVLLICFAASFCIAIIGCWAIADSGDRLMKKAEQEAPKFIGWHMGERVYYDEKKKGLIYVE